MTLRKSPQHNQLKLVLFLLALLLVSIPKVGAQVLTEDGMQLKQVNSIFNYERSKWRKQVFQLRKEGRQAEGYDWDTFATKDSKTEAIMYAQWQKAFPTRGTNLLQISPSFKSETEVEEVKFIWSFYPKIDKWRGMNLHELCENIMKNSRRNLKDEYYLMSNCDAILHDDLKTIIFQMSATIFKR